MRIEIGGGTVDLSIGDINLDPNHGQGEWRRLAQDLPWPAGDNTVDFIRASHVMEHIPAGKPRIDVMNECWRVLKPGGRLEIFVPLLVSPDGAVNIQAIADPTHVSYWCFESFAYFDGQVAVNADYGIRQWHSLRLNRPRETWEAHWIGIPLKTGQDVLRYNHELITKALHEGKVKASEASE